MSISTLIQWTDDTVNPVMGCGAPCELRPTPVQVLETASGFFTEKFPHASRAEITKLLDEALGGHNATEIYQLRSRTVETLINALGESSARMTKVKKDYKAALDAVYICYAHQQTMMRGSDITNPSKITVKGFPVQFEILGKFPGRMAEAAMRPDLYGKVRHTKPWLDYLPRVFFVSDMADSLSEEIDFPYLRQEIIDVVSSARGQQHIWLWLTKMPKRMAHFAEWLKCEHYLDWPDNLVAMTSVTSMKTDVRARQLLKVPARFRGLSIEPLWEDVVLPPGIDWCIVGGQSGPGAKSFDVAWIESLQEQCRRSGTAFFVKQLGAKPMSSGKPIELKHEHGGDWNEWPVAYRIREMPAGFWDLRVLRHSPSPTNPKVKDEKLPAPAPKPCTDAAPGDPIAEPNSLSRSADGVISSPAVPKDSASAVLATHVATGQQAVKVTTNGQQRYQPSIIRQRFTFRISESEDGWGIWDKDIGRWYIEPTPGVRPPDFANLLPQVQTLKNSYPSGVSGLSAG
jgi:protein gp37